MNCILHMKNCIYWRKNASLSVDILYIILDKNLLLLIYKINKNTFIFVVRFIEYFLKRKEKLTIALYYI